MTQIPIYVLWYQQIKNESLTQEEREKKFITWTQNHPLSRNHQFIFLTDYNSFLYIYSKFYYISGNYDVDGHPYEVHQSFMREDIRFYVYDHPLASGIGFKRQKALIHGRQYDYFAMIDQNVVDMRFLQLGDSFRCTNGEPRTVHDFVEYANGYFMEKSHVMILCPTVADSQGKLRSDEKRHNETIAADKFYVFNSKAIPFDAHYDISLARFGEDRDFYVRYYHNGNIMKDKQYVMCIQEGISTKMSEEELAEFYIDPYVRLIERDKRYIRVRSFGREVSLEDYIDSSKKSPCYEKYKIIPLPEHASFYKEGLTSMIFNISYEKKKGAEFEVIKERKRDDDRPVRHPREITCHIKPVISEQNLKYTQLWMKAFETYFDLIDDKYYHED